MKSGAILALALVLWCGAATVNAFKLVPTIRDATTGHTLCNKPACVQAAASYLKNMNASADPCDDFHNYVCGNYIANAVIPEEETSVGTSFYPIRKELYERGKTLLEEPIDKDVDWDADIMAKELYQSCVDMDTRNELGSEPLDNLLQEVVGGWPILKGADWQEDSFDWISSMIKLREKGFSGSYLLGAGVDADLGKSKNYAIYVTGPGLGLSRDYLTKGLNHERVKYYYELMQEIAEYMGAKKEEVVDDLKDVLQFEMTLANHTLSKEKKRNISVVYNEYKVSTLPQGDGYPEPWLDFIKATQLGLLDDKVSADERVIVTDVAYIKSLATILKKTPKRTIANLFAWRMAYGMIGSMDAKGKEIYFRYKQKAYGLKKDTPLWRQCVSTVGFNSGSSSSLKMIAGSMYVRRYFPEKAKEAMEDMVQYLKDAFRGMIEELDWMDSVTKEKALAKLEAMSSKLAYPDELIRRELIDDYFKDVAFDSKDYLGNVLRLKRFFNTEDILKYGTTLDPNHWHHFTSVAMVNAFADFLKNSIMFPAGILQGSFFNYELPRYFNYPAIGGVIGHEITHNFDDIGKQFDKDGNLANWWEAATSASFKEKAQCIIDQFSAYVHPQVNMNLNGVNTQGENIADIGGVKQAYIAYDTWVKDNNDPEPLLPGLGLNQRQLFWVGWANNWCSKAKDETLKSWITTDSHSPGMHRVIGPLSNNEHFARDFNCPVGSRMNPEKKCNVW